MHKNEDTVVLADKAIVNSISNNTAVEDSSHSSDSETEESEKFFQPELLGLLDNPGVVRVACLDYPWTVTEHGEEEGDVVDGDSNCHWLRLSHSDITKHSDFVRDISEVLNSDVRILSRSMSELCYEKY